MFLPGGELVGHPLAVSGPSGLARTAARHPGKIESETGIPATPALRVVAGQVGGVFDRGAETGGADEGAVGTGEASIGDFIPSGMLEIVEEQAGNSLRLFETAAHIGRGFLHNLFGGAFVFYRSGHSRKICENFLS